MYLSQIIISGRHGIITAPVPGPPAVITIPTSNLTTITSKKDEFEKQAQMTVTVLLKMRNNEKLARHLCSWVKVEQYRWQRGQQDQGYQSG